MKKLCLENNCWLFVACVLLVIGTLAPAYGQDSDIIEKAKQEKEFVWWVTHTVDAARELFKEFTKKYPFLKCEVYKQVQSPMIERIRIENARGEIGGDVTSLSGPADHQKLIKEGYYIAYKPPEVKDWPPNLRVLEPYGYPTRLLENSVIVNTKLVSKQDMELLRTWEGVVNPRWRGKICIGDPNILGSDIDMYYNISNYPGLGKEWISKLVALKPAIYTSHVPGTDAVVAGEYEIGIFNVTFAAEAYRKGAPVAIFYPSPTPTMLGTDGVLAKGRHPNAGKLFLSWLLSKEGQSAWSRILVTPVPHPEVIDSRAFTRAEWFSPVKERLFLVDFQKFVDEKPNFLKFWNASIKK